jgi:hypothetical protein
VPWNIFSVLQEELTAEAASCVCFPFEGMTILLEGHQLGKQSSEDAPMGNNLL